MKAQGKMVAGRMRIAYSVPKHREYMRSGYPSEPILAEAAASIWARYQQKSKGHAELVIPKMLKQLFLTTDIIAKGERGELVARLILTLAYDAAVRQHRVGEELRTVAVPLETFLQELFGETNYALIADSKPDFGHLKFRDAFKDTQVRFTHFVRAEDDSAVSTEAAYAAILRSMAFQCSHGQRTIDIMLPLTLKDEPLREGIMSGMLISIKDRVEPRSKVSIDIDASKLSFFPKDQELFGDNSLRPYITLVMELGIPLTKMPNATGGKEVDMPPLKKFKAAPRLEVRLEVGIPKTVHSTCLPPPPRRNPRYRIYAYGCSPLVYKVVTNKHVFASLLSSCTLLAEHPRQTNSCLKAVKELKPFWSHGAEFYGWLKDVKTLNGTSFTQVQVDGDEMDTDSDMDAE
jgi:hypothetical protein